MGGAALTDPLHEEFVKFLREHGFPLERAEVPAAQTAWQAHVARHGVPESNGAGHGPFIHWPSFWTREDEADHWLLDGILARGRGHSIWAKHKVGKSLVMLWCALELVRAGVVVIYLDYEMTEDDLRERLEDMGAGQETDLSLLRYALLPMIPPLDTKEGGAAVVELVDAEKTAHPDHEVALVIDTIGRAVEGEENPADTIRDFYRHTGISLKQRGVTWARLDHAGWEGKHARGSSAKGDDVDVIWKLEPVDGGVELRRDSARMGWVPEKMTLRMEANPLRFERTDESWPNGTYEVAGFLDELGVPLDSTKRDAQKALQQAGRGRANTIISAALRWRRIVAENAVRTKVRTTQDQDPKTGQDQVRTKTEKPHNHGPGPRQDHSGPRSPGNGDHKPPYVVGGSGPSPDPDEVFG